MHVLKFETEAANSTQMLESHLTFGGQNLFWSLRNKGFFLPYFSDSLETDAVFNPFDSRDLKVHYHNYFHSFLRWLVMRIWCYIRMIPSSRL